MAENPRETLAELVAAIRGVVGDNLTGLYLWGSLASGNFHPGRSDLDLVAVLASEARDDKIDRLRTVHEDFETARPAWRDRVEVLYLSRDVLGTFAGEPRGRVVRVSPGEPLHHRELDGDMGWLLDWHGVMQQGETLFGPPPETIGPAVDKERVRAAVMSQLRQMRELARQNNVAYVPAQQGYIVATVSRLLYTLATGRQTSKADAIEWAAVRFPDSAEYLRSTYAAYRADVRGPHERLIAFVDEAAGREDRI